MEKERLRFSVQDDIVLLREVLLANPFTNNQVWTELTPRVHQQTGKCFTVRAIKDHVKLLMEFWMNGDVHKLRRRGTEEDRALKEQLLEQVMQLRGCYRAKVDVDLTNIGIKMKQEIETDDQNNASSPVCMEVPVEVEDILMNGEDETDTSENIESNDIKSTGTPAFVNGGGIKVKIEHPNDQCINSGIPISAPQNFLELKQAIQLNNDVKMITPGRQPAPTNDDSKRPFVRRLCVEPSPLNISGIKSRLHQRKVMRNNPGLGRDRVLRYLERKSRRDSALERTKLRLKERELKLKEDQLALDIRKFELEKIEREDRIKSERLKNQQIADQQQIIIDLLKEKNCKSS